MSYAPQTHASQPHPPTEANYYSSTPPPPPPKPSGTSTPTHARYSQPPPPPPTVQADNELSELDADHDYGAHRQNAQPQPSIPTIESSWLPESLKEKSTQDLQYFLSTPGLQQAFLANASTTHPAVPASENCIIPIINSNLQLSHAILSLEEKLSNLRLQTQQRLLALRALEQAHRQKIAETEHALREFSPMALYQRLNASVQEQELLARGVEESWFEEDGTASEREVAEFVRGVKERKRVAFLRKERQDRWDEGRVGGWR